jgi:hypothetical protein
MLKLNRYLNRFTTNIYKNNIYKQQQQQQQRLYYNDNEYRTVPHYEQKTALYIRPKGISSSEPNTAPVFERIISPEIDLDKKINSPWLLNMLEARHIHLNVSQLKEDYNVMCSLKSELNLLSKQQEEVSKKVSAIISSKGKLTKEQREKALESDEVKQVLEEGKIIKSKYNKIYESYQTLEEIVMLAMLRLPNKLHFSTPMYLLSSKSFFDENHIDIFEYKMNLCSEKAEPFKDSNQFDRPTRHFFYDEFDCMESIKQKKLIESINEIPSLNDDLNFGDKYFTGINVNTEQALVNYFQDKIAPFPFEHVKSVSMFKSCVVEGCGKNYNDIRDIYNVVRFNDSDNEANKNSNIELLHLTGAGSVNSLIVNFIRTEIKRKYLPWNVFTNGKSYSPKYGQYNSFDTLSIFADGSDYFFETNNFDPEDPQTNFLAKQKGADYLERITTELDDFVTNYLGKNNETEILFKNDHIDSYIIDYLKFFLVIYGQFNIPLKFKLPNASELRVNESIRIELEAYLPSEDRFVTVSSVVYLCLIDQ